MEFTRRSFLGVSAGGFASWALRQGWAEALAPQDGPARACIVLWLDGGPSHIDTFDPKPGRETGGSFAAIDTAAKGVRICEHLPRLAKAMDRVSLVRSLHSRDLDHGRAAYFMHTGYAPSAMLQHPSLGAIVAHERPGDKGIPPYALIRTGGFTVSPLPGPGFLGPQAAPFVLDRPEKPDETLKELGTDVAGRIEMIEEMNREFRGGREDADLDRRRRFLELTRGLPDSPFAKALDLRGEKEETVAAYLGDNRGKELDVLAAYRVPADRFGYACLLARRLVEAGVRFVEVDLGGWDTHADNFRLTERLLGVLDPAFAALVGDLDGRGLLDSTLVVCMGEFGRTPQINQAKGRDHWSQAYSAALAGGGIAGGRVVGETDADGAAVARDPVSVPDLLATIVSCFGVDPAKKHVRQETGLVKVTDAGKAVRALMK